MFAKRNDRGKFAVTKGPMATLITTSNSRKTCINFGPDVGLNINQAAGRQ